MHAGTGDDLDGSVLGGSARRRLGCRQGAAGDQYDGRKAGGQDEPGRAKEGA